MADFLSLNESSSFVADRCRIFENDDLLPKEEEAMTQSDRILLQNMLLFKECKERYLKKS